MLARQLFDLGISRLALEGGVKVDMELHTEPLLPEISLGSRIVVNDNKKLEVRRIGLRRMRLV